MELLRRAVRYAARRPSGHLKTAFLGSTLVMGLLAVAPASAVHGEVSLSGSNFEIDTDANLKPDDLAPSFDWADVTETRVPDSPSGSEDESFGQGTKEDTAVPTVVTGGIPPNKSDLKFFGLHQEGGTATGFLNLYWSRVQEPSGTTNMDFELNKRDCTPGQTPADADCSANGITPLRSVGDKLIIYDLSKGGTVPVLSIRSWDGSAWGPATDLSASSDAAGSINSTAIPAGESDGLGAHSARTFGEAQIRLSALFAGVTGCDGFGSAYLKSRASDSFTAALKDFVPPESVSITNCGTVRVHKRDDAGSALNGVKFDLYTDIDPVGDTRNAGGVTDPITNPLLTCTTNTSGNCTITNVPFGNYWVVEDPATVPAGHEGAADQSVSVTQAAPNPAILTFINNRQFKVITFVCAGSTTLHASKVSYDGAALPGSNNTPVVGTPAAITAPVQTAICGLTTSATSAVHSGGAGPHTSSVSIP